MLSLQHLILWTTKKVTQFFYLETQRYIFFSIKDRENFLTDLNSHYKLLLERSTSVAYAYLPFLYFT
jgi:hypothetical protein